MKSSPCRGRGGVRGRVWFLGRLCLCAVWLAGACLLIPTGCVSREPGRAVGSPAPQAIFDTMMAPTTRPAAAVPARIIEDEEGLKGSLIYTCRHARPEVLRDAVEGLISPEGSIQASPALNTLVIADSLDVCRTVLRVLEELDRQVCQLLVEARIVEVTVDSDLEYEIRHALTVPESDVSSFVQTSNITLKTPGATPTSDQGSLINIRPWVSDSRRLDEFIRLLMTRGKARILSSPNLLVSAGSEASIITGEEVPVQSSQVVSGSVSVSTNFKRVGIKLRVVLQQITHDTARLEINPEVSTVTGFTTGGQGITNPIVAIRNVSSTLSMKDGEILTVGGLLRDEDRQIVRGVPLLMDVPYLGVLFQSRRTQTTRSQLIFFMRIHILEEGQPHTARLHRPGSGMDLLEERSGMLAPGPGGAATPGTQPTEAVP